MLRLSSCQQDQMPHFSCHVQALNPLKDAWLGLVGGEGVFAVRPASGSHTGLNAHLLVVLCTFSCMVSVISVIHAGQMI